jgi:hypothetical protein
MTSRAIASHGNGSDQPAKRVARRRAMTSPPTEAASRLGNHARKRSEYLNLDGIRQRHAPMTSGALIASDRREPVTLLLEFMTAMGASMAQDRPE